MKKLIKHFVAPALLIIGFAASPVTHATLVTTDVGYTGPFIDLSGQANGNPNYTFGPVALPGMIFTRDSGDSVSGFGAVLGQFTYGLGSNGQYDTTPVYAGLDWLEGAMRFTLTGGPVSSFGAYVSYFPGAGPNPIISALDASNNIIESWDLAVFAPVSTPGGLNAFEFRGISLSTPLIYGLQFEHSYMLATGTPDGIPLPAVPEPQTYALMLAGLGLLTYIARRRKSFSA